MSVHGAASNVPCLQCPLPTVPPAHPFWNTMPIPTHHAHRCCSMQDQRSTPTPGGAQTGQPCTPTHSGSSVGASTQLGSQGAGIQEGELELKASHFWILVPVSAPGCFHGNWRRTSENKVRVCSGGPLPACLPLCPSGPATSLGAHVWVPPMPAPMGCSGLGAEQHWHPLASSTTLCPSSW